MAQLRWIKVFISSTFCDMQKERDHLVKFIFPQLRKLCETRGITFGEVDLRWGITDEQRAEGKVLPTCLAEIHRCRPYFIGLLGERYGWIPASGDISQELLDQEPWLDEHPERSVTELEILHGVLNNPAMASRAFFYFRDPAYIDSLPANQQGQYREKATPTDVEKYGVEGACRRAEDRKRRLAALKDRIRTSRLSVRENYPDPETLGAWILSDLTNAINQEYPPGPAPPPHELDAADHEAFAESRAKVYIGRQEYFDRLDEHASSFGPPLVVLGESGSGKSALLANWALRYRAANECDLVLMHFIGANPYSSDWAHMLRRVIGEFQRRLNIGGDPPEQADELRSAFADWLRLAGDKCRVVLIFDGLNQLEDIGGAPDLVWLPPTIPANVRFVCSTLPGRALDSLAKRGWPTLTVRPLRPAERLELTGEYLAQYTKTLSPSRTERLASSDQTDNPLYLRALLEELRLFGVHERLDERIAYYLAAASVPELYQRILERYEEDFDRDRPGLVRESMSLLWAARHGLSDAELLDLLGSDDRPLPQSYWSPLYLAAEQALINRGGVYSFSHHYFRQAIQRRYFITPKYRQSVHLRLARYFARATSLTRRVEEWPWQLLQARSWDGLYGALTDPQLVEGAWDLRPQDLSLYWRTIEANSPYRLTRAVTEMLTNRAASMGVCFTMVTIMMNHGELRAAAGVFAQLADYFEGIADPENAQAAHGNAGISYLQLDAYEAALKHFEYQEQVARRINHWSGVYNALSGQAVALAKRGDYAAAEALLKQMDALPRTDDINKAAWADLGTRAFLLHRTGATDAALAKYQEQEQSARASDRQDELAGILGNIAATLAETGCRSEEAEKAALEQLQLANASLNVKEKLRALDILASIALGREDYSRALELYREQEPLCRVLNERRQLFGALIQQAVLEFLLSQDVDRALVLTDEAARLAETLEEKDQNAVHNIRAGLLQHRRPDPS